MSRTVLQFFGLVLLGTALRSLYHGDHFEAAVTAVLGIGALLIATRASLLHATLPALRGLSLSAITVAAVGSVLPGAELVDFDAWSVLLWFALGVIGLYVFFLDERELDQ